jgi:hypothetical protein
MKSPVNSLAYGNAQDMASLQVGWNVAFVIVRAKQCFTNSNSAVHTSSIAFIDIETHTNSLSTRIHRGTPYYAPNVGHVGADNIRRPNVNRLSTISDQLSVL